MLLTVTPRKIFSTVPFLISRLYYQKAPEPTPPEVAKLLTKFASHPPRPINLSTLLSFGRLLSPNSVLRSASYALSVIPRRLATRVRSLESLPFIVGTNPYIASTLYAYRESFKCLATYPPVTSLEENAGFAAQLDVLVQDHANDIPVMAKG
jgi:26S proteasome regulatory subunit T1